MVVPEVLVIMAVRAVDDGKFENFNALRPCQGMLLVCLDKAFRFAVI